jgi:hypothetical protein
MICTCGGENENCIYCAGFGEKNDRMALVPYSRPNTAGKKKAMKPVRISEVEKCPKCKFMGTKDEINKHSRYEHPKNPDERLLTLREEMRCPLCEDKIHRAQFELHLAQNHKTTWRALEALTNAQIRSLRHLPSTPSYQCPLCDQKPHITQVLIHLDSQHHVSESSLREFVAKGASPNPEGNDARNGRMRPRGHVNESVEVNGEDKLEAHRYMGYVIRESGKYGSHPLHDRHDDESMP